LKVGFFTNEIMFYLDEVSNTIPHIPDLAALEISRLFQIFPRLPIHELLEMVYPLQVLQSSSTENLSFLQQFINEHFPANSNTPFQPLEYAITDVSNHFCKISHKSSSPIIVTVTTQIFSHFYSFLVQWVNNPQYYSR
jgi:hypothetical protein